jgi:diguanylate cyclase (GGDEF)-like protein
MQKAQMNLIVIVTAVIIYGGLLALLGEIDIRQMAFIGVAFATLALIPVLLINLSAKKFAGEVSEVNSQLSASKNELAEVKSRFAEVTTLDELTGCSNKRHFEDLLIQHAAMSERGTYKFTVAVAQVDQFSEIIDRQGLGRGNQVLQLFSRIVKAALREVDVIARLDTDKFGLVLSGCSEEDALVIINRIGQLISQIQVNDKDDLKITASGGITSYHGTEQPQDLIEHAEEALQFAIEQGRDRGAAYNYVEPVVA